MVQVRELQYKFYCKTDEIMPHSNMASIKEYDYHMNINQEFII